MIRSPFMKEENRRWRKMTLTLPPEFEERGAASLIALGAEGVWVEAAPPFVALHVFFPDTKAFGERRKAIRARLSGMIPQKHLLIQDRSVDEEDWQTAWRARSIPRQRIGRRLIVAPPWDLPRGGNPGRAVVEINPAMAFGTGTHPTTRGCLVFLEASILKGEVRSLLDVGTGSGILAIAAAKLGVKRVTAVENDPIALKAAEANAVANGVASGIVFRKGVPRASRYACVVANLTAPTLLELAPSLHRAVSAGGKMILSGILRNQVKALLARYERSFSLLASRRGKEWVTLLLARR